MNNVIIKIQDLRSSDKSGIPVYSTVGAAGADCFAHLKEPVILKSLERCIIPTGLKMEIPEGYEVQVRPRSGLAIKNGISVLNAPGTIDCDYRGEVGVILINLGKEDFIVNDGDRIAQLVVAPYVKATFTKDDINVTERGAGGFGSTGV